MSEAESTFNATNRGVYIADNLLFLRSLNDESVDLICIDPPFAKAETFAADQLKPALTAPEQQNESRLLEFAQAVEGDDIAAYLCYMAVRIIEVHRVLKRTGSLYLHCDDTANVYLRGLLSSVFGPDQFRQKIVWGRSPGRTLVYFTGRNLARLRSVDQRKRMQVRKSTMCGRTSSCFLRRRQSGLVTRRRNLSNWRSE